MTVRLLRWPERDQRAFERHADRLSAIRRLAAARRDTPPAYRVDVPAAPEPPSYLEKAQTLYLQRRERDKAFGPIAQMFYEPVWDMLLDLFVAHETGAPISISSACVAACVPISTALRWIRSMEAEGLVRCWPAEHDKRVRYIALTDDAVMMMLRYLDGV